MATKKKNTEMSLHEYAAYLKTNPEEEKKVKRMLNRTLMLACGMPKAEVNARLKAMGL